MKIKVQKNNSKNPKSKWYFAISTRKNKGIALSGGYPTVSAAVKAARSITTAKSWQMEIAD